MRRLCADSDGVLLWSSSLAQARQPQNGGQLQYRVLATLRTSTMRERELNAAADLRIQVLLGDGGRDRHRRPGNRRHHGPRRGRQTPLPVQTARDQPHGDDAARAAGAADGGSSTSGRPCSSPRRRPGSRLHPATRQARLEGESLPGTGCSRRRGRRRWSASCPWREMKGSKCFGMTIGKTAIGGGATTHTRREAR